MRAKCFSFVGSSVAFFCRVGGVNSCDKEPRHVCVLLYFARRVLILAALSPPARSRGHSFPLFLSFFSLPLLPLSSLFPSSPLSILFPSSPLPPPLVPLTLPVVFPSCFLQLVSYSCDGEEVAEKRKLRRKKGDKESGAWSLKGILGCLLSAVRCRPRIFCSLAAVPSCVLIFYSLSCSRLNEDGTVESADASQTTAKGGRGLGARDKKGRALEACLARG